MNQRQQTRNTSIQQKSKNTDMENNLSDMEQQLRRELTDGSVRLSEGRLVGRVLVEIEMDMLTVFFNKVQQQRDGTLWLQEKELMEREISGLKAQLALTNQRNSSEETRGLKSQLATLNETLCNTQTNLEQQTSYRLSLLQETGALTKTLVEKEEEWKDKENTMTSMMERIGKYDAQLKEQKKEMNILKAALQEAEHQSATNRIQWQEEKASLLQEAESLKETLVKKEQEKESTVTSQLDIMEKSRAVYVAQLEEQKREFNTLTAVLKEAKQRMETDRVHWQEDNSSLLKETEALKKDLLKNQQDWEEKERAMTSQLEDLQDQILKKQKKKKKWYRRFF